MKHFFTILILITSWQYSQVQPGHFPRIKLSTDSLFSGGYGYDDYSFSAWGFNDSLRYQEILGFEYERGLSFIHDSHVFFGIWGDRYYNGYFPEQCTIIEVVIHNLKMSKKLQLFIRISNDMSWNSQIELQNLSREMEGCYFYDMYKRPQSESESRLFETSFPGLIKGDTNRTIGTLNINLSELQSYKSSPGRIFELISEERCPHDGEK